MPTANKEHIEFTVDCFLRKYCQAELARGTFSSCHNPKKVLSVSKYRGCDLFTYWRNGEKIAMKNKKIKSKNNP